MPEDDATTTPVSPRHAATDPDAPPTRLLAEPAPDEQASPADPPDARGGAGRAQHARAARSPATHGTHRSRPRRRVVLLAAAAVGATAGIFLAGMAAGGSTSPTPVAAPALPVAATPIVPVATPAPSSTPTSTTSTAPTTRSSTRRTSTTRTTVRPATDTAAGCGHRAVARGVFNAACSEYQGYLDPGRAAGRAPSSGDLQHDDGCQKGYIPKSEC
jgi:hypothetical protein